MDPKRGGIALLLALGVSSSTSPPAAAVDGVIEINQARALAGGLTPGDDPGFPVTISLSGSYRLTSDLNVPLDTDGIVTQGDAFQVTLDLNGFTIYSFSPSAGNTPSGISAQYGWNIRVHDGTIRGFYYGIGPASHYAWIQSVWVIQAKFRGIDIASDGVVVDSFVNENGIGGGGGGGIFVGDRSIVRGCKLLYNTGTGIQTGHSALVTGNVVTNTYGITAGGIVAYDGSTVTGNTVNGNYIGVLASTGVTLLDNTARSNFVGFSFTGSNNGYARNVLTNNTADVVGTATELGTNFCGTDTVCP